MPTPQAYYKILEERDILRKALERIAAPRSCGCVPCCGQCRCPDAIEIENEEILELAKAALKATS